MTRYLRTHVALGWVALVIALLGAAVWVNGGFGLNRSALASRLLISTLLGSAAFAIALLSLPAMQRWALRDGTDISGARQAFRFIAAFAGCLGLGILVDAALKQL